jgi:lipid-A-disaccharide synthase
MTVRFLNMLNLILDRAAVPEFLQEECTAANLAREMIVLLKNPSARASQIADANEALRRLGLGQAPASMRAAETILQICNEKRV